MTQEELFYNQAKNGYTVCYTENCPLRTKCLRWLVGQQMPDTAETYRCVNPHFKDVATAECPLFRSAQKVRFAKGMLHIFTSDMPRKVEPAVRYGIIGRTNRTYYFEYRKGDRLIPPTLQEHIRQLFRNNGWTAPLEFDSYVEDYEW